MPYIAEKRRAEIYVGDAIPENAGELNYFITMNLIRYMSNKPEKYQIYNDILGVLEGAKQEIYRRKIAPYEDLKIKENGDVF